MQTVLDGEARVHVRIVDESFPPCRGARLLEVNAHDDEQRIGKLCSELLQALRIIDRCSRVVDRARTDDQQQARIRAIDYAAHCGAAGEHEVARLRR